MMFKENYSLFGSSIFERLSIKNLLPIHNKGLISVNLALSNVCGADCIFCPDTKKHNGFMPISMVKKIAGEVASDKFRQSHGIKRFSVSENGDAFLNPEFIEILRCLKTSNPDLLIVIATNFQFFTEQMSKVIIKEKLLDSVMVNIDGYDNESYYRMKRIPYKVVEKNIMDFLRIRSEYGSRIPLLINCLTFADYYKKMVKAFGSEPLKNKDIDADKITNDFELVKAKWITRIDNKIDSITKSGTLGWAERDTIKGLKYDHQKFKCYHINRVEYECFISPNGDWYACCFDEEQKLVIGNVLENSINEIYNGDIRKEFIKKLKNREFEKIGYPCCLVESCQAVR